ncbi:MAG TPA: hypothetical protein VHA52_12010 [Candidatus Babeliaceae bacterium]|nr:hypothetical protein [Candidatus Babeliaceae bacterium]HVZ96690.1 hypothetical protein [Chitinophagaceae bacterium]
MPSYYLSILLNHSIIIPAAVGIFRFRQINNSYYPFLFTIWLGLANESLSLALILSNRTNVVNANIYVLLELLIILYQFYKWQLLTSEKLYGWAALGALIWIADNLIINNITGNNSLFRVVYSFLIIFLSIQQVSKMLVFDYGNHIKNATFIICLSFLLFYTCKGYIEAFNVFHTGVPHAFLRRLWITLNFINFITNMLYTLAIICMPKTLEFTFQY